jgi:alpha-tubulin suppressor-like RCC1 family protein
MRDFGLVVFSLVLAGCALDIPEGRAGCMLDSDCPATWSCRREDRGGRCWRTPSSIDAGELDAGDVDAGPSDATVDGGGPIDDGGVDANRDAGCAMPSDCDDGVSCNTDLCDASSGICTHVPRDDDGDDHDAICGIGGEMFGDDCDDTRASVHPGAPEICDGDLDDDCDTRGESVDDDVACEWLYCNADACDVPVQVSAGGSHACVRTAAGRVFCWGADDFGQLGTGAGFGPMQTRPVEVTGFMGPVDEVTCGARHTCAIDDRGVVCWGDDAQGQLGDGLPGPPTPMPSFVLGTAGAAHVGAGNEHSCMDDGATNTSCWGANGHGQLGDGTTMPRSTPTLVIGSIGARAPSAGVDFTCARGTAGGVYCFGANDRGQIDGTGADHPTPVRPGVPPDVVTLDAGDRHVCAYRRNATGTDAYVCWGANEHGQLGNASTTDSPTPVMVVAASGGGLVTTHSSAPHVAAGGAFTCATDGVRQLYCWGSNDEGQLGVGAAGTTLATAPVETMLTGAVHDVDAGEAFACAVLDSGEVWCWGANESGQLGDESTSERDSPVRVVAHSL